MYKQRKLSLGKATDVHSSYSLPSISDNVFDDWAEFYDWKINRDIEDVA
jgi:hypothetical protein